MVLGWLINAFIILFICDLGTILIPVLYFVGIKWNPVFQKWKPFGYSRQSGRKIPAFLFCSLYNELRHLNIFTVQWSIIYAIFCGNVMIFNSFLRKILSSVISISCIDYLRLVSTPKSPAFDRLSELMEVCKNEQYVNYIITITIYPFLVCHSAYHQSCDWFL